MLMPYVMASHTPDFLFWARFRKKLTVMGMMGQTQGVSNAGIEPRSPALQADALPVIKYYLGDFIEYFQINNAYLRKAVIPGNQRVSVYYL